MNKKAQEEIGGPTEKALIKIILLIVAFALIGAAVYYLLRHFGVL